MILLTDHENHRDDVTGCGRNGDCGFPVGQIVSQLTMLCILTTRRWTFSPLTKDAMMGAMWAAIGTYRHEKLHWASIMERGMSQDYSWDRSALQYEQVFGWAMIDPPYA